MVAAVQGTDEVAFDRSSAEKWPLQLSVCTRHCETKGVTDIERFREQPYSGRKQHEAFGAPHLELLERSSPNLSPICEIRSH